MIQITGMLTPQSRKKETFYNFLCLFKYAIWRDFLPKSYYKLAPSYKETTVTTLDNMLSLDYLPQN